MVKLLDNKEDIKFKDEEVVILHDASSSSRDKIETFQSIVVKTGEMFNSPKHLKSKSDPDVIRKIRTHKKIATNEDEIHG